MMRFRMLIVVCFAACAAAGRPAEGRNESAAERNARMQWWREARFGLFIHWGLYAVPAGEWNGRTDYGEWIRNDAKIPLKDYEGFVGKFNPRRFDPASWVKMAKAAGMKYIVITTKHHDGFCMFDAQETDFNVMSTPFRKDVMKALADACRKEGMKICWYYSIMDWHHPDYLPRRAWETDRPDSAADWHRYIAYMKSELRELLTEYGPVGVLWFDGQWAPTWNASYGRELYDYVRSLQPAIIINNRVGAARPGMEGLTQEGEFAGDFGTPEQEVPATGIPGADWETCMTMNDHWGYNSHDANWKSSRELIRTLVDIASKGGNFLLNIGPTSDGVFPQASIDRLRDIGAWMNTNGDAVHGTAASPFRQLPWGRCTETVTAEGTRLYLHVFDWPAGGTLSVPGVSGTPVRAFLLAGERNPLPVSRREDALLISVPPAPPDTCDAVVVLEFRGAPGVNNPPVFAAGQNIFVDSLSVAIASEDRGAEIRYTSDGSLPGPSSPRVDGPVVLTKGALLRARSFRGGRPVSPASEAQFSRVAPLPPVQAADLVPGVSYTYYEGAWDSLPDFRRLPPVRKGNLRNFETPRLRPENYGFAYDGFINVPVTGVYAFFTESDDGSRLLVDGSLVVDNDGLHGMLEKRGVIALSAGLHALRVLYFNGAGGAGLAVSWRTPGADRCPLPGNVLSCRK